MRPIRGHETFSAHGPRGNHLGSRSQCILFRDRRFLAWLGALQICPLYRGSRFLAPVNISDDLVRTRQLAHR